MTADALLLLGGHPGRIAIFEAVEALIGGLGESQMAVAKTQISWGNPKKFALLSLPRRAGQGGLILTFGLGRRLDHPRIDQTVEPYPDRWTHHVVLTGPEDVDETVADFLRQAYQFAQAKTRRRRI